MSFPQTTTLNLGCFFLAFVRSHLMFCLVFEGWWSSLQIEDSLETKPTKLKEPLAGQLPTMSTINKRLTQLYHLPPLPQKICSTSRGRWRFECFSSFCLVEALVVGWNVFIQRLENLGSTPKGAPMMLAICCPSAVSNGAQKKNPWNGYPGEKKMTQLGWRSILLIVKTTHLCGKMFLILFYFFAHFLGIKRC